jgi:hypothetical protein
VVAGKQHPYKFEHGCDHEPQKASNRRFLTTDAWIVSIATAAVSGSEMLECREAVANNDAASASE